jgi:hypothetical protein
MIQASTYLFFNVNDSNSKKKLAEEVLWKLELRRPMTFMQFRI